MKLQSLLVGLWAAGCSAKSLRPMKEEAKANLNRRLNCQTDIINQILVEQIIPAANGQLDAAIPDPYKIDERGSIDLGRPPFPCNTADIVTNYTVNELTGQRNTRIDSIIIREGTEEVCCCCCSQSFSGIFDIVLCKSSY